MKVKTNVANVETWKIKLSLTILQKTFSMANSSSEFYFKVIYGW